jgi:pilus assembly protein CpaF
MSEAAIVFPESHLSFENGRASGLLPARAQEVKSVVHRQLIDKADLEKLLYLQDTRGRQLLLNLILQLVADCGVPLSATERTRLANEVMDEVFGLGPLEPLLQDPSISDILVNTHKQVYIERKGLLELTTVTFRDGQHLLRIIDKIVSQVGRRVDESTPMVDARLSDG